MQILEDRIVYSENDWLGGLVPQAENSVALSVGEGAAYQRNVNPFRYLGSICPGMYPTEVTNIASLTTIISGGDIDNYSTIAGYAYLVGGSLVHKLDLTVGATLDTISATTPWPHTIDHGHASEFGDDLKIFTIVNGATSTASVMALYSFTDATDGDVGAFDISSGALNVFYDNFLSTQPTDAFTLTKDRHPMIVGDDGALYIGNGNSLAKLIGDGGGNGTLSTPLSFPRGTVIRSFTKYPDYLVIFAKRNSNSLYRGTSVAYFWNYQSKNYNFAYDLSDNEVTAGFNWLGTPGCFTYGRKANGKDICTKLKLFNGTKFEQVLEYDGSSPTHGAVEIYDSMITWVYGDSSLGKIGTYGSPWPGRIKNSFNFYGEATGTGLTTEYGGFCSNLMGKKLYVSSGAGSPGGLQIFEGNFGPYVATGSYFRGIVARPSFPSKHRGKIKSVKVHFRRTSTAGRTLKLDLYVDGITTYSTVFTGLGTNSDLVKEYLFDTNNSELPHFHGVFPVLTWDTGTDSSDAPIVSKLEIFYEPIKFIQ
jgi:hypothetical protein